MSKKTIFKLAVLLSACVVPLAGIEAYYRIAEATRDKPTPRYVEHRYLGYDLKPGYDNGKTHHNSHGFRGPEIGPKEAGEFRICCLGGSTTYDTAIGDDSKTYPAQLEAILRESGQNVRVINCGGPGWTTTETLINLQIKVLDLQPDMLVVYHAINDVHTRIVAPEHYTGDMSAYRIESARDMPEIARWSVAARSIMVQRGLIPSPDSLVGNVDHRSEHAYNLEFLRQHQQHIYPTGVFKNQPAEQMIASNPPIYFERNMRAICSLAESHKIPVVVSPFEYMPFHHYPCTHTQLYRKAIAEHNAITRKIAKESGNVHLAAFEWGFPQEERYFVDGRHNTEAGAKLKAEMIAETVMPLIKPRYETQLGIAELP